MKIKQAAMDDFHKVNEELRNSTDKANGYANLLMPVNANIGWISYALVAIIGAILGINELAGVTIGTVVTFVGLNRSFTNPITQVSQQINFVVNAAAGANLSQGQRQLLAIARAAVADPPALILDEATSSIDTRTEKLVQSGMDALMKGRTTFVIAHRLSTVKNSDCIMVMEQGRIIERGTHDELIEAKGKYYQLYTGNFAD